MKVIYPKLVPNFQKGRGIKVQCEVPNMYNVGRWRWQNRWADTMDRVKEQRKTTIYHVTCRSNLIGLGHVYTRKASTISLHTLSSHSASQSVGWDQNGLFQLSVGSAITFPNGDELYRSRFTTHMRRPATPPVSIDNTEVRLRLLTESCCQGITNEAVFKAILHVSENTQMKRADGRDRGVSEE